MLRHVIRLIAMTALCGGAPCRAALPPILKPVPVLEHLIRQGGVWHGNGTHQPELKIEFRVDRGVDEAAGRAIVYRLELVVRRADGKEKRRYRSTLQTRYELRCTPSYYQTENTECLAQIRTHPRDEKDTLWHIDLDDKGRPRLVRATHETLFGSTDAGTFPRPESARFDQLHGEKGDPR